MADLKKVELLAPAGDLECIRTDIKYGADAIYCGGPFMQLRASKVGFTRETLQQASEEIHAAGRKLFVTVNSFPTNDEIPMLGDYVKWLKDIGTDAIIVSDIGAITEIKSHVPDMEIHVSTQANCMNYKAAETYYNLGASRIVLARELSIERIAEMRQLVPKELELEAFIHGAMCMSYSGRCLLSSFLTGRSGNRGECAQPCRWNYYLMEEKRPGEYFKVEESDKGMTILSSKELCAIEFMDKLADAGICSFKIEGRMRTPYSIGVTVNAYRMAMDGSAPLDVCMHELDTTSHRPFCSGFFFGDHTQVESDNLGYERGYLFVATAKEKSNNGKLVIKTRNAFSVGDELEVVSPGKPGRPFTVTEITDEEGNSIQRSSHPMAMLTINAPDGIEENDLIRRKSDN